VNRPDPTATVSIVIAILLALGIPLLQGALPPNLRFWLIVVMLVVCATLVIVSLVLSRPRQQ
jgi:hypothetical protein